MKKIYIRADGNPVLGSGHIMRCCSIAEELERRGVDCCFLVADKDSVSAVEAREFQAWNLDSSWNDLEKETSRLVELVQKEKIELLFIDSYYVSERYLETLRHYTKIVYLTGTNLIRYPVDMLINYHIYADQMGYQEQYDGDTDLVLGCRYVPLRKQFMKPIPYDPDRRAVFVTTGATDPYHVVPKLLERLQQKGYMEWDYHIVIGKYYDADEVESISSWRYMPNIFLYRDVRDMAALMGKCSVAVSAAGSTLYELCACGIPTVTFSFADNQERPAEAFSCRGLMESAGDIRDHLEDGVEHMVSGIQKYISDREFRVRRSAMVKESIDGKGAQRLAERLIRELESVKTERAGSL